MESVSVNILGVPISRLGMQKVINICSERIKSGKGGYVCFANVHTVTESTENAALQQALSQSFLSVADGLPLVWVSKLKNRAIASRVCGPDFVKLFIETTKNEAHSFIGGSPGQAEKIAQRFGISAVTYSTPVRPFSPENARDDWQHFLSLCKDGIPPRIVWVGLGAPKQELWMQTISAIAPNVLFFGVGAAFDFLSDTKARAPLWMQKSGLEWFFRLVQEPRRLAKRYFVTNTKFMFKIAQEILSSNSKETA